MNTLYRGSLFAFALSAAILLPSRADDAPLQGNVTHWNDAPQSFRLSRSAPHEAQLDKQESNLLRGFADTQKASLNGQAMQQGNQPVFRALDAKTAPLQGLVQRLGSRAGLMNIAAGSGHWTPSNPDAPYVWCQSMLGGYYDASNTCKNLVWGDKLREYGGKFQDGTLVPIEMVTVNSKGHVWYQSDLSRSGFLNRKDFPHNGAGL